MAEVYLDGLGEGGCVGAAWSVTRGAAYSGGTVAEQRKLSRVPLDAEVTLHDAVNDVVAKGQVSNITMAGIAVASDRHFEPGRELQLRVMAGADRKASIRGPMTAKLQVLRCSEEGPPYLLAGHFLEVTLP